MMEKAITDFQQLIRVSVALDCYIHSTVFFSFAWFIKNEVLDLVE